MAKTKRVLKRYLDFAHLLLYTVDARAPLATFAPKQLPHNKEVILVFTKEDLADPQKTEAWKRWFKSHGHSTISSNQKNFFSSFKPSRGLPPRVYTIIMGLPNIGKSTLINRWVGKKKARTGALPGITRGPQWIKIDEKFYLLDTPGIFFKEKISEDEGWKLAAISTIPEKIYANQIVEVVKSLLDYLRDEYQLFQDEPENIYDFLKKSALRKGILLKGGELNLEDAAKRLLADFQRGAWGRITLESPKI